MTKHSDETDAVMRSKYAPLYHHLCEHTAQEWQASFAEIESILGFPLPQSAYNYPAWWANEKEGMHYHARAWLAAGWETYDVNLAGKRLVFKRVRAPSRDGMR